MCGLISILDWAKGGWSSEGAAVAAVRKGLDTMLHRGLEGQDNIEVRGRCVLGHVRLPIINLTDEGRQPMTVNGMTAMLTGELLNYRAFNPEAMTDTRVLIDIIRDQGLDGLHRVDGFWAAVVALGGAAYAFNDYLGQKPLYVDQRRLLVASEPLAAVRAADLREVDEVNLANSIKWGYDPTGGTPWKGLRIMPPGHVLYSDGAMRPYWDWNKVDTSDCLRGELRQAVHNRMVGDRKVGLLLSGGLDSTVIYQALREIGAEVDVFHVSNGEEEFVKLALNGRPATELNVETPTWQGALIAHQVPVDLGSMIPQLGLAKAVAGEDLYVCMSGDGADELFGGYRRAKEYDSQASDVFMELPYYHLPRLDRLMMRYTVELRTPFLAPRIVKYALDLPYDWRTNKEAIKSAFRSYLPRKILTREKEPLKSSEVKLGGLEYRKQLVDEWRKLYVT